MEKTDYQQTRKLSTEFKGKFIQGQAIAFNTKSNFLIDPKRGVYKEVIKAGAITNDLLNRSDIKLVAMDNNEKILARCQKGKGTLNLWLTDKGLFYRFLIPDTSDGQFIAEMIKRGDINTSGFSFVSASGGESWIKNDSGFWERTVYKMSKIYQLSIITDQIYDMQKVKIVSEGVENKKELELLRKRI